MFLDIIAWLGVLAAVSAAGYFPAKQIFREKYSIYFSLPFGLLLIGFIVWLLAMQAYDLQKIPAILFITISLGYVYHKWVAKQKQKRLKIVFITFSLLLIIALLLSYLNFFFNTSYLWWIITLLLLAWGLLSRPKLLKMRLKKELFIVITLFLIGFTLMLSFRYFIPEIRWTEKPMEFMILSSAFNSPTSIPQDNWFAGQELPYYYFGYWLFAGISKMSIVPPELSFNFALSTLLPLSAICIYVMVRILTHKINKKISIAASFSGVYFFLLPNMFSWFEFLSDFNLLSSRIYQFLKVENFTDTSSTNDFWWWWRSTRITNTFSTEGNYLDNTISEFPFFSFILGDLHPHLIVIPFALMFASYFALLYNKIIVQSRFIIVIIAGFMLGVLGFINTFDLIPATLIIFLFLLFSKQFHAEKIGFAKIFRALLTTLLIGFLAWLIFMPFYPPFGSYGSQLLSPPIIPAFYPTRLPHFLIIWGLFAFLLLLYLILYAKSIDFSKFKMKRLLNRDRLFYVLLITFFLLSIFTSLVIIIMPVEIVSTITDRVVLSLVLFTMIIISTILLRTSANFSVLLALVVLLMILAFEYVSLHDIFGNRLNTYFKSYFISWFLLSCIGGYLVALIFKKFLNWPKLLSFSALLVVSLILIAPTYYQVRAIQSRVQESQLTSLDGTAFIAIHQPQDAEMISWLKNNVTNSSVILEVPAEGSYTQHATVSTYSGMATVLGWAQHEQQWRGNIPEIGERLNEVREIYTTPNEPLFYFLVNKYGIDYIIVGDREVERYGTALNSDDWHNFSSLTMVFSTSDRKGRIFKVLK